MKKMCICSEPSKFNKDMHGMLAFKGILFIKFIHDNTNPRKAWILLFGGYTSTRKHAVFRDGFQSQAK
jgi:hypothetical protein